MKIKKGYVKVKTSEGWAVAPIGEESKRNRIMLTLNDTASEIWDMLCEGKSKETIVAALVEKYGITTDRAEKGVSTVIEKLSQENILEECTSNT